MVLPVAYQPPVDDDVQWGGVEVVLVATLAAGQRDPGVSPDRTCTGRLPWARRPITPSTPVRPRCSDCWTYTRIHCW